MKFRLIASFLLLVLVITAVFMLVLVRQNALEVSNFITRGGLTGSEQVVTALEEYYETYQTWEGVENVLNQTPQTPRGGMFGSGIGRNQSQRLTQEQPSRVDVILTDDEGNLVAYTGDSTLIRKQRIPQSDLQRGVPLIVRGKTVGYLLSEGGSAFTAASQISLLARLNRAAVIAVGVAGAVAIILALILSYTLIKPVLTLQQAASQIAAGDLSQRVPVEGNDELSSLGRTFNRMAESLQSAQESRMAMTADIAHELRTPLAVQRANLEAIEDGVYPLTIESLRIIEEQNHLLTRLVEDLRTLALVDAGNLELQRSMIDFPELVRGVINRFEVQAGERGIKMHLSLEEAPAVLVDPQRIQQILHNLLNNALRFTPQDGEIWCKLRVVTTFSEVDGRPVGLANSSAASILVLEVQDSGPGIPQEALPRIFDRFYRGDKSRTRSEGGTGLGLSIARKLAQAHGGDLTAANHPQGGAVFTLWLPL